MSESTPTIVVVEDEKQIRRFVRSALEAEGCRVVEAETGKQGLVEAGVRKPDLIVLDLGLPDLDGVEFIRDLRGWSAVSILILSARSTENDKIVALDAGADDYLTKPFGVGELLARVRALLRRQPGNAGSPAISFGEIEVDFSRRLVIRRGEPVHLTQIEFRLLALLIANAGKVLTHRHLLRDVWGPSFVESNHYLRIYVARLRQKLEADPAQPKHILTETGVGYRFQANSETREATLPPPRPLAGEG
ncbi:MAG: two-component system response regulator KdpE [Sulfuricella sp.]|nr:two-component system response regulator KdpE [Sulfuricella sp.]